MARSKSPTLTEAELRLMNVLWEHGPSSVAEVANRLPKTPSLAYSTVLTTMRILEEKGYVRHTKDSRAFVYHAVVDREEASRSVVRYVVSRFFRNSPEALLLNVIKNEKLTGEEMDRLKKMIEEAPHE
jgi:predicted transcriptional regulator